MFEYSAVLLTRTQHKQAEHSMTKLLSIGECMMELNAINPINFKRAFAGDTYNTAVYAQRWAPELSVYYMSALGTDSLSEEMLAQWKGEGLNTDVGAITH